MPEHPIEPETVAALVADAAAAPSLFNAQPWKFRFDSGSNTFELRLDPDRTMPHTDPSGRALHIGCAAALFNLRVSAAHAGWDSDYRLLPAPDEPELLATLRLTGPAAPDCDLVALHPAVQRRHTSRDPFEEREIPADVQQLLSDGARQEGAELIFPSAWHAESLLGLVRDAEGREVASAGALAERDRWTRIGPDATDSATDGVPDYAFGPTKRSGKAPIRDFAGRQTIAGRGSATFESSPNLALLGTAADQPADWLTAGQAMERVLLLATLKGLATSLTSQTLEHPDLRWVVRDPRSAMGYVQMVIRMGYGPPGPRTPRRPPNEVLRVD